ncbi:MAG: DUF4276 family protein [Proteobacteria bacterium]|nr:DUF4276 family protein [Pseudomonadota bacterium]
MRLGVSVEGPTERDFVNHVMKPHLILHGWNVVKPVSLNGGVSLHRFRDEIRLLSPNYEWVTTLYDLYRFDGREGRDAEALEATMADVAGGVANLIPYVQRYEFEALVFSDPETLANEFRQPHTLKSLRDVLAECGSPENINHDYHNVPSRRLQRIFSTYDKVVHGAQLAGKIGLPRISSQCPRFACWLAKLEALPPIALNP